jgi:preprotein translocase subunit SecG
MPQKSLTQSQSQRLAARLIVDVRQKIMRKMRWIACFPGALMLSFLSWGLLCSVFTTDYYGPLLLESILGLSPLVLRTAIPAAVFVIGGTFLSPSKARGVGFIFFALAPLFSAGGGELFTAAQSDTAFWLSAMLGTILGAFAGLCIALRIQRGRQKKEPSQPSQTTPASSAPLRG